MQRLKNIVLKLTLQKIFLLAATAFFVIIVGIRVVSYLKKSRDDVAVKQAATTIRVNKITRGDIVSAIKISGTIRPANEVEIFTKAPGRVLKLNVDVGDQVKAGQVLAIIEHRELELALKAARAALAMAKSKRSAAKTDLDRSKDLLEDRAISQAYLEDSELKYDLAHAQVLASEAEAEMAAQRVQDAHITSPITGTVMKRNASIGTMVSPTLMMFIVQDISRLILHTSVDKDSFAQLSKGTVAQLNLGGEDVVGKVVTVSPSLDPQTRRALVEIDIDTQHKHLVPNMFVDGSIVLDTRTNVLTLPYEGLVSYLDNVSVFKIVDGEVRKVNVTLGRSDNKRYEVLEGLEEGDIIAVTGLDRLKDGTKIIIEDG